MSSEAITAAQRRLNRVPAPYGWKIVHLGNIFDPIVDTGHKLDLPVLSVTVGGRVVRRSSLDRKSDREVAREKYLRVLPGDIAYNTMRMWQGASGLVSEEGYVSPAYTVCRPRPGESSKFWAICFQHKSMIRAFRDHSQGFAKDRYRLYYQHFATVPALRPPLSEQHRIADILYSVDETIEEAEAVIKHLQLVKKTCTQELLLRGFPGRHVDFQETIIGRVPREWQVTQLRDLLAVGPTNGRSPRSKVSGDGVPTFSIAAVRDGVIDVSTNVKYADVPPEEVADFVVRPGDLLIVRGNASLDRLGQCAKVTTAPEGCIYPDLLMRIIPKPELLRGFLVDLWNSPIVHNQLLLKAKTTNGTYKVNQEDVASTLIPVPPKAEQERFETIFAAQTASIIASKREVSGLIDLKSALFCSLLSGDIRVRPPESAS